MKKSMIPVLVIILALIFIIVVIFSLQLVNKNIFKRNESAENNQENSGQEVSENVGIIERRLEDNDTTKVCDITEDEENHIRNMMKNEYLQMAVIDFEKAPEYNIKFNDTTKKDIGIRINSNNIFIDTDVSNNLYVVDNYQDVCYILDLLNIENQYKDAEILDFNTIYMPPNIYLDGTYEFEIGTYTWKGKNSGNNLSSIIDSDSKTPKEILKDKEAINISTMSNNFSLNKNDEQNIKVLPYESKITYKIYQDEESSESKEAVRRIDGSYYFETPNQKGEYILEVILNYSGEIDYSASYFLKINV